MTLTRWILTTERYHCCYENSMRNYYENDPSPDVGGEGGSHQGFFPLHRDRKHHIQVFESESGRVIENPLSRLLQFRVDACTTNQREQANKMITRDIIGNL